MTDKSYEFIIISSALLVACLSYFLVARKDGSWINWMTPAFVLSLGSKYILELIYIATERDPSGSRYAYLFCYSTYALSTLLAAVVYSYVKPVKLKPHKTEARGLGSIAWLLLLLGLLFYFPVLLEFRAYLAQPRRIYEMTRSGYGIYFYTSTFFATVGFSTYLFYKKKRVWGVFIFCVLLGLLTFCHGSKGQIVNYLLIYILYRIYIDRQKMHALAAASVLGATVAVILGSYAMFSTAADILELFRNLTSYADGVRHAMQIIDDPTASYSFGRLMVEREAYNRVPRVLMPGKPKDFGGFALAKRYAPAEYRNDDGAPNYDIGELYADFGPFSLIYICISSAFMGWLVSVFVADLRRAPSPGRFLILIFLSGLNVIPISGVFFLPETMLVAGILSLTLRFRLVRAGTPLQHTESSPT